MELLSDKECINYNGGAIKITTGAAIIIAGVISFLAGVFSGITNPKACNK